MFESFTFSGSVGSVIAKRGAQRETADLDPSLSLDLPPAGEIVANEMAVAPVRGFTVDVKPTGLSIRHSHAAAPAAKPQAARPVCARCEGSGRFIFTFGDRAGQDGGPCHTCRGKGWQSPSDTQRHARYTRQFRTVTPENHQPSHRCRRCGANWVDTVHGQDICPACEVVSSQE